MGQAQTEAVLRTAQTRVHVYTYRYDTPSRHLQRPGRDVIALCTNPARHAAAVYRGSAAESRPLPLGRVMVVPAAAAIDASGPGGDRRLAVCTVTKGLLPDDFDPSDPRQLALCGDVGDPRVRYAMERMMEEALAPGFAADLLVDALVGGLVVDLARYLQRSRRAPVAAAAGRLAPWQLRRIEEYVATSLDQRLRTQDLANTVDMSARHLARSFKSSTGRTIHAYVEEARLARAQALLRDGDLSVKGIAAAVGFATPSSFTMAFRRASGSTPARYRADARRG